MANSGLAIMPVRTSRCGGSLAKISPMRDRSRAGRAVGRVVHLEDQRRARGNALRHARQEDRRVFADRPVHEHLVAGARDRRAAPAAARARPPPDAAPPGCGARAAQPAAGAVEAMIGRTVMTVGRGVGFGSRT